jgi:hypothetical protein
VSWLLLGDAERLIVPRLGALAPPSRFQDEVRALVSAHGASIVGGAG